MKIYPEIILKASNANKPVGAFRVWFIAKDYDTGNSNIPAKAFRHHLRSLGIDRATFYRWIRQAIELGLLSYHKTPQGVKVYSLTSWERGAALGGVTSLLKPVNVPLERFTNKGWLSWVWACYLKHFEGKLISRATLKKLSGVPERTQQGYERQAWVTSKAHFANYGDPSRDPEHAITIDGKRGIYGKAGMTRRRLPDSRTVEGVKMGSRGRTKKANKKIAALLLMRCSSQKHFERLYCETYQQLKKANRAKKSDVKTQPDHRYLFITATLGLGVWEAIPC